jgi:hypothetical protein
MLGARVRDEEIRAYFMDHGIQAIFEVNTDSEFVSDFEFRASNFYSHPLRLKYRYGSTAETTMRPSAMG